MHVVASVLCLVLSSVQSFSCVQFFVTPWTRAPQASLSITNCRNLLKLMSVESVMPPNHLILCRLLLLLPSIFPSIRVFSNEQLFASGSQSIGVSASTSVLPVNIKDGFFLGWTGWISLQSLSCVQLFATPWTVAHQASLSMEFSRQGYWSRLPFLSPGDLPKPGIKPESSALQAASLLSEPPGKPSKLLQSCPTLCDPVDCQALLSIGILQAVILGRVAMSSCRRSSQPRNRTHISYISCIGRQVL